MITEETLNGLLQGSQSARPEGQRSQRDSGRLQILFAALSQPPLRLQLTGRIFHGSLNRNFQLADAKGRLYLLRIPHQKRRSISEHLATTYREEGFTSPESFHRHRPIAEQARLMQQAAREGIRVLPAVAIAHDARVCSFHFSTRLNRLMRIYCKGKWKPLEPSFPTRHRHINKA